MRDSTRTFGAGFGKPLTHFGQLRTVARDSQILQCNRNVNAATRATRQQGHPNALQHAN
jgi:hypothetical protein